jgi:hypothetical protein
MFSDVLKKVDKRPSGTVLAMASGAVFVLLLAGLVQVLNRQVEQAQSRQAQHKAAQVALSNCMGRYSGAVLRQCIDQVNARLEPYSTYTPTTELQASAEPVLPVQRAGQGQAVAPAQGKAPGSPGFMQAAFSSR